jgi:hypothetical protein
MSGLIKKISKRTLFIVASVVGFAAVSIIKVFFGGSGDNAQTVKNQEKKMLSGCCDIPSAKADVPTSCSTPPSGGDGGGDY